MYKKVEEYLEDLKKELEGTDPAVLQDALSDAEDHLRTGLDEMIQKDSSLSVQKALAKIIEDYGTPGETAAAYREIEKRLLPGLSIPKHKEPKTGLAIFFSVLADPKAWGAFVYMIFAVLTGTLFGLWAFLGMTVSLIAVIFIFGIPISSVFLLSLRGIALIEGRIIEATLGVRMPRKPIFINPELDWLGKIKTLFSESQTWKSLLYFILLFPIGLVYFGLISLIFVFSLGFIFAPFLELVLKLPLELFGTDVFTPVWLLPFVSIFGFLLLPSGFHLAKWIGKIHSRYAKFMLVRK